MSDYRDSDIALVGLAGCYAGARDARVYWQNILDKVDAVTPADEDWTGPYLDPNSTENDRIYTNKGGFLGDLAEFNPAEFGIMPSAVDGGEPDHYLGLRLARDALIDAGYGPDQRPFDGERAGVVLGRGTYFNRGYSTILQHGLAVDQTLDMVRRVRPDFSDDDIAELRRSLKAELPSFNTEMAPGLVPNVATGIIANRLNLMGPNYIIDAACASSLIAMELAMRDLRSGEVDMMITGGVQAHSPPQLFMLFCQLGALSRDDIRPFDAGAGGTLLGEGAGMLVLKRVRDAERDNDRIYAVIKGVGQSSDGRAKGLLAPRQEGEVLALRRAYEAAGVDPATVGLIEAHGTGIAMGDATEVAALTEVFGERSGDTPGIALGSVKSMISHCIPAAGSASTIKAALSLHHGVLPPTLCDEVNPDLGIESTPFYINNETRPWIHGADHPRRAGVNAFGFGGVNAHAVLEAYVPPAGSQVSVLHAPCGSELFVLAADSAAALVDKARTLAERVRGQPAVHPGGLARALAEDAAGAHRLALPAAGNEDLVTKLDKAAERIESRGEPFKTRAGVAYGTGEPPGKLAFLFPGEGAQYPGMLADLAVAFPQMREWFDLLDSTFGEARDYRPSDAIFPPPTGFEGDARDALEARLFEMDLASESVFTASQGLHTLLADLGIRPDAMVGHSTGENSALVASGHLHADSRAELARISHEFNGVYKHLDANGEIVTGTLLTVGALDAERRGEILAPFGDALTVAMDNCPNQAVIFGQPDDVADAHEQLAAAGAICSELPFGRAYHTARFQPVADAFREFYATIDFGPGTVPQYSCATVDTFPEDGDAIRDLACAQWAQPVRFRETLDKLYDDGFRVFVEVGPSANLTSFVTDTLRDRGDVVAISTNSRRQPDVKQLHGALAQLFALGVGMDPAMLYADRDVPAVDPWQPPGEDKPSPRLKLEIPVLQPGNDWSAPALPEAAPSAATGDLPAVPESQSKPEPEPAPEQAPEPRDARTAAVQSHFALMQEFLDSQARVLGLAGGQAPPQSPGAGYPLLGAVTEQSTSRLVAERHMHLDHDLYLRDHCLGGQPSHLDASLRGVPVVPFTFSMELLAEAAVALAGSDCRVIGFEDVSGSRWLGLPHGALDVRTVAEPLSDDRVRVRVFELDGRGEAEVQPIFEGSVRLAAAYPEAPQARTWNAPAQYAAAVNPAGELYSHGMFHGPRLQGVQRILRWSETAIEAELAALPTHDYFADSRTPAFTFDAALLDAAGQVVGYWLTERFGWQYNCFPYWVQRMDLYAAPPPAGTRLFCRCDVELTDEHTIIAAFDVVDAEGGVMARAEGWTDRRFPIPQWLHTYRLDPPTRCLSETDTAIARPDCAVRRMHAFPEGFLEAGGGLWAVMVAHMLLGHGERPRFHALPEQGSRREEWLVGRIAAKESVRDWLSQRHGLAVASADIEIEEDERGKPFAVCPAYPNIEMPSISLAHSHRCAAAAAGDPGTALGVDLQALSGVRQEALETGAFSDGERSLLDGLPDDDRERAAVVLWCAKEAAAKAAGLGLQGRPLDWTVVTLDMSGGTSMHASVTYRGETFDVRLTPDENMVFAMCEHPAQRLAHAAGA